ncbi:MAG: ferric-dicitrate binding protein FerR (iron transport regulator) [Verrucomicrobiales bacterium]|jgi:ferric-dicitrate binding protein FerR (iron transport regulator)
MNELSAQELEWVESHLNGTMDPESFEALQDRMMESPALRKVLRRYFNLDYHLHHHAGDLDLATRPRFTAMDRSETPRADQKPWHRSIWAAAAAIVVLAAGLTFSLRDSNAKNATISAIHGPVRWTNNAGHTLDHLEAGSTFDGGLLESLLPESWVELAFQDGSKVTMSGHSTLMVSAGEQKQLHLRQGNLSAEVAPQPESMPMVVNTPTAELKVLGTQFDVDAERNATRLIVNEGRVQMKRLVDGSSAEVPRGHQVVAAVDVTHKLEVVPRGKARQAWRSDLAKEATYGKWSTDLGRLAIKLKKMVANGEMSKAEAMAKYKEMAKFDDDIGRLKADSKMSNPGKAAKDIIVLSLSKETNSPVIATVGAKFRIRGNLEAPATLEFGFTTYRPGGSYAGKFRAMKSLQASGEDGFDIELSLKSFRPIHQKVENIASAMEIREWWCASEDHGAQLEITHVELLISSP